MLTSKQKEKAREILVVLSQQRFNDFYNDDDSPFVQWLTGAFEGGTQEAQEAEEKALEQAYRFFQDI